MSIVALAVACAPKPQRLTAQQVLDILARGRPFAEDSFYACLVTYYQQGLSFKQIQELCETKLGLNDKKGFGEKGAGLPESFTRTNKWFDPASITAACHSGDPAISATDYPVDKVGGVRVSVKLNFHDKEKTDMGVVSWNGKDICGLNFCWKGLTGEQSLAEKQAAIDKAGDAIDAWKIAQAAADADPDNKEKQEEALKKLNEAKKAVVAAKQDPNKIPKPPEKKDDEKKADDGKKKDDAKKDDGKKKAGRPGPGESECGQALEAAREAVGECHRTGWQSGPCKSLWAKLKGCPDPALIYVDPESGYACGAKIDPEQLKQAFIERCRELKRPVPGGPDPCAPPSVDSLGRFATGKMPDDMCNNPYARVDPDSPDCYGTLKIQSFGPNLRELQVWGLNKLGGPIVVLNPKPDPSTDPGGQPKPKPTAPQ